MSLINKKGFTLIELLAVIIVLAVVTLLAVQTVLPQVEKARKNVFIVEANHAIDAAKQYHGVHKLLDNTNETCVTISQLVDSGYFDVSDSSKYAGYVKIIQTDGIVTGYKIKMTNGSYKTKGEHTGKLKTSEAVGDNSAIEAVPSGDASITNACP